MPLGNLLNYVKENKSYIRSKNLLNWCLQISQVKKKLQTFSFLQQIKYAV